MTEADVLVVGGGIAGLSAAWHARQAGRDVLVVDAGVERASALPVALINPLRGHTGRLVVGGVDGARATLTLIDRLRDGGHRIAGARGLYRPLVDLPAAACRRDAWSARLGGRVAFEWHDVAPALLGLATPVPALYVHDAGWVAPGDLLAALTADCGATLVADRVDALRATDERGAVATLASGGRIAARRVVWCGGARGAAWLGALDHDAAGALSDAPGDDGSYRPGSLLSTETPFAGAPLAFGLYAVPLGAGGATTLVGPTRESATSFFASNPVPAAAVRHLADRVARTFGATIALQPAFRGVRLTRLSSRATRALAGIDAVTALGSRGFLMAPLRAEAWARSL